MISKINLINTNTTAFRAKKKIINHQPVIERNYVDIEKSGSILDKIACGIVINPRLANFEAVSKDYNEACDLISTYNNKYDDITALNSYSKANFNHYMRTKNYWYNYAVSRATLANRSINEDEKINKDYQTVINRPKVKTFIQYDENLSPLYAVVKDFEGQTILDFENNLVMKNYSEDDKTGEITIEEVYVFDTSKTDNLYSDISRSIKRAVVLFNVVQKSNNSLNASAMLTYIKGKKNTSKQYLENTYIKPQILYFKATDSSLVKSEYKAVNDDDGTMNELISKDKAVYKDGIETASKNNGGKLFQMYNIGNKINYARLVPPQYSSLSECYVKLFD